MIVSLCNLRSCDEDKVHGRLSRGELAHGLTQAPFDSVSSHGAANALADGETCAGDLKGVWRKPEHDKVICPALSDVRYAKEVYATAQTRVRCPAHGNESRR